MLRRQRQTGRPRARRTRTLSAGTHHALGPTLSLKDSAGRGLEGCASKVSVRGLRGARVQGSARALAGATRAAAKSTARAQRHAPASRRSLRATRSAAQAWAESWGCTGGSGRGSRALLCGNARCTAGSVEILGGEKRAILVLFGGFLPRSAIPPPPRPPIAPRLPFSVGVRGAARCARWGWRAAIARHIRTSFLACGRFFVMNLPLRASPLALSFFDCVPICTLL